MADFVRPVHRRSVDGDRNRGLLPHMYADDAQLYGSCRPSAVTAFTTKVSECVEATTSWMRSDRLQLNPAKTEVLWCATARRQHQLPTPALLIDGCSVSPVKSVRDLRIYIDNDLTMRTHVKRTVSRCFASLRQLRQIRHLVPTATLQMLVVSFAPRKSFDILALYKSDYYYYYYLSTLDWTMEIVCWLACRLTCYVSSSRY